MKPCCLSLWTLAIGTLLVSAHVASGQQAPSSAQAAALAQAPANSQQAPTASTQQPASARPAPGAAAQAAPREPQITLQEGALTVQAKNVSVRWLVNEIAREARIALQMDPQVPDQKINVDFQGYPVEAAVHNLLKDYDAFYYFGVYERPPARLQIVWVYPKGKGAGLEPIPPEQWASTKELKEQLASKDPVARAKAIEQLVERVVDGAQDDVLEALRDPDSTVRTRALYTAQETGVDLPAAELADVAISDENSFARFLALDAIGGKREFQWVVERALNDPDKSVQAKAQEILERWRWADEAGRAQPPPRTQQQVEQEINQQQQSGAANQPRRQ